MILKKIKNYILLALAGSTLLVPALVPALVSVAAADSITGSLCTGVNNAANGTNAASCGTAGSGGTTDLHSIASRIVSIFSIVVGIIAVIMIIYGGFRYITSGGDSGKVGGAKNSLIYAIIGLIIVALAQLIVHYVINTATSTAGSAGIGQ